MEEIDGSSALVLTETPIFRGSHLRIQCGLNYLRGAVKACTKDVLGYFVEVKLDSDSHWSPQWFTPEHLLMIASHPASKVFLREIASGY